MHLVHGAKVYFPQDLTDTVNLSLFREAIIRDLDLHKLMVISVLSPGVYYFTQLSQKIQAESKPGQENIPCETNVISNVDLPSWKIPTQ